MDWRCGRERAGGENEKRKILERIYLFNLKLKSYVRNSIESSEDYRRQVGR